MPPWTSDCGAVGAPMGGKNPTCSKSDTGSQGPEGSTRCSSPPGPRPAGSTGKGGPNTCPRPPVWFSGSGQTFATFQTPDTRLQIHEGSIKLPQRRHAVYRLTRRIRIPAQGVLGRLQANFWGHCKIRAKSHNPIGDALPWSGRHSHPTKGVCATPIKTKMSE